jgi:hypothetical protein
MMRIDAKMTVWTFMMCCLTSGMHAMEPKVPFAPDAIPYDWKCVYPYSETSCEMVLDLWAKDHLDDPTDISMEIVSCGNCTEIRETDWNGSNWIVGFRCNQRYGYHVDADNLQAKIPLYRDGGTQSGWSVLDWALFRCVQTWQCHEFCTWERGEPVCFVVQVIGVGRLQPVLGNPCDPQGLAVADQDTQQDDAASSNPVAPTNREGSPNDPTRLEVDRDWF